MTKTMYAGMELEARCGRCKMETKHRILSITDGVPEKLICVNCNAVHKYKPERVIAERPSSSRATGQAKAARPSPRQSSASPSNFQQLMISEQAGAKAKPYGQGVAWEEGMWVDHPSFGLGKIQHKAGRKIDVLFHAGLKTLMAT